MKKLLFLISLTLVLTSCKSNGIISDFPTDITTLKGFFAVLFATYAISSLAYVFLGVPRLISNIVLFLVIYFAKDYNFFLLLLVFLIPTIIKFTVIGAIILTGIIKEALKK